MRCAGCAEPGETLCARCRGRLRRIEAPLCDRCGAPTAWPVARCSECSGRRLAFATARAAVVYDDTVKRLVAGWKEHGLRRTAELAAEIVVETMERPESGAIAFVPPDLDRTLKRGHHPAERQCAKLSKLVPELAEVEVELSEERNPSNPANQVAEATIWAKGETLRGREATKDMKASIDQLVDKLERQMKRYRERRRHRPR